MGFFASPGGAPPIRAPDNKAIYFCLFLVSWLPLCSHYGGPLYKLSVVNVLPLTTSSSGIANSVVLPVLFHRLHQSPCVPLAGTGPCFSLVEILQKAQCLEQEFLSFLTRFSPPKNLHNVTPGMERQGFKDPSPQGRLQLLRLGRSPSTVLRVSSPPCLQDCRFVYWSDTSCTSRPFRSMCVLTLEPADA